MWSCWLIFYFVILSITTTSQLQGNDTILKNIYNLKNESFKSSGYKFPILILDEDNTTNTEELISNSSKNALKVIEPDYLNLQNVTYQNTTKSYNDYFNTSNEETGNMTYLENNIIETHTDLVSTTVNKTNTNDFNFTNHHVKDQLIMENVNENISKVLTIIETEPVEEENKTLNETQEEGRIQREFENQPYENINTINVSKMGEEKGDFVFRKNLTMAFKTPQDNNSMINYKNMMIDLIFRLNSKADPNKRTITVEKPKSNKIIKKYFKENTTQNPMQPDQISPRILFLEPRKDLLNNIFLQNLVNKLMNKSVQRKRTASRKFKKMSPEIYTNGLDGDKILALKIRKLRSQMFEILLTIEQIKRMLQEKEKQKSIKESKQYRSIKNQVQHKEYGRPWKNVYLKSINTTNLEKEDLLSMRYNFLQQTNFIEHFFKRIIDFLTKIYEENNTDNINQRSAFDDKVPMYSETVNENTFSKIIFTNEIRNLKNLLQTFNVINDRFIKNIIESIENIERAFKKTPTSDINSKSDNEPNIEIHIDDTVSTEKAESVKIKEGKVEDRRRRRKISDSGEAPVKYMLGLMGVLLNESLNSNESIDEVLGFNSDKIDNAKILTEEIKDNFPTTHKTDTIKEDNLKQDSGSMANYSANKRNSNDKYVDNEGKNLIHVTSSKPLTEEIVTLDYRNIFSEQIRDVYQETDNNSAIIKTKENIQNFPITHTTDVTTEDLEKYITGSTNKPNSDDMYVTSDRNNYIPAAEIVTQNYNNFYSEEDLGANVNNTNNTNIPIEEIKLDFPIVHTVDTIKKYIEKYNPAPTEIYSTNTSNSDDMYVADEGNNYVHETSSKPHSEEELGVNVNKTDNSTIPTEEIKDSIPKTQLPYATNEDIEKYSPRSKEISSTNPPNSDDMYVNVNSKLLTEKSKSQNLSENNHAYQETIDSRTGIPGYVTEISPENIRHSRLFFYTNDDDLIVPMKVQEDISTTDVPITTTDSRTEFVTYRTENHERTTSKDTVEENTIGNENLNLGFFMNYKKVYNSVNSEEDKTHKVIDTITLPDESINSNTNLQNIYEYENADKAFMKNFNQVNNARESDYQQFKNGYHFNSEGFLESVTEEAESHTMMNKILRRKNKILLDYLDYGDNEPSVTENVVESENKDKKTNANAEDNEGSNRSKLITINLQKENEEPDTKKEIERKKNEKHIQRFDQYQDTPSEYVDAATERIEEIIPVITTERIKVIRPLTKEQNEEKINYGLERDAEAFLDDVEAEDSESYFVI